MPSSVQSFAQASPDQSRAHGFVRFLTQTKVNQLSAFAIIIASAFSVISVLLHSTPVTPDETYALVAHEGAPMALAYDATTPAHPQVLGRTTLAPVIKLPGTIQGYRTAPAGQTLPDAVITAGAYASNSADSSYTSSVPAGQQVVTTSEPTGYDVFYSVCTNCTEHPDSSYVQGNAAIVTVTSSGYVDVWWKYVARAQQNTGLTVSIDKAEVAAGGVYVVSAKDAQGQIFSGATDFEVTVCDYANNTQCGATTVMAPLADGIFSNGRNIRQTTSATPSGLYKFRIRPAGQSATPWSNLLTVKVSPVQANALSILLSSSTVSTPATTVTVPYGGTYTLYAKQGGQNYNGQLEYQLQVCQLSNQSQCSAMTTGPWGNYTLSSGQVTVGLDTTAPGVYKAKFRPRNQTSWQWSNEIVVTVNAASSAGAHTYQEGNVLFLDTGALKVGADIHWGGAITHVLANGLDMVNRHDTGREAQFALYDGEAQYDGCAGCSGTFGWDPVQGGDTHGNGSAVLSKELGADYIYTKTAPIHWNPSGVGGGAGQPVVSDVVIEQWVRGVPGLPSVAQVQYKITHTGTDTHTNSFQELPAFYVNKDFSKTITYAGDEPWTNGATSTRTYPPSTNDRPFFKATERWAAQVNSDGVGVGLFAPGEFNMMAGLYFPGVGSGGPNGDATYYLRPECGFSFSPGSVAAGSYYIATGSSTAIRQAIYALHNQLPASDTCGVYGYSNMDTPTPNQTLSGSVVVGGWLFDNVGVQTIDVLVDGIVVGQAWYGAPRPDVIAFYPGAPTNAGYGYTWDTTTLANGNHTLQLRVTDTSGIVSMMPTRKVVTANSGVPTSVVRDGYVDTATSASIAGWTYDSSNGNTGQPVTIVVVSTSNSQTTFSKTVQPSVVRGDAAGYLHQTYGPTLTVTNTNEHPLGFVIDPATFISTPGTYKIQSVATSRGYAVAIDQAAQGQFVVGATSANQLSVTVGAVAASTQGNAVSVPAGSSYALTAKQGTASYTVQPRQLDYQLVICDNNGANCGNMTTGAWGDYTLDANGQVIVSLGSTPPGVYKAKFRPRNQTTWNWSNEVVVSVTGNSVAPATNLYGVHSALEWKTFFAQDEHIDKLKELGVQVSRSGVFWQMVEPVRGQKNWTLTDKWVNDLNNAGIKPLISILGSAAWANGTTPSDTTNYMMVVPTEEAAFNQWVENYRLYVHEMVVRYKDKVKLWELWNEPNWHEFWLPAPNPEHYVRWAQVMEREIKSVQPDAQVAYAGLTVLDGYSGMTAGDIKGKDFLQAMYNAGARPDIVSLHPYALTNAAPDQYSVGDGISTFRDVETIKAVMDANGQSSKKLWLTEFGWDADVVTEAVKAQYLERSFSLIRDSWPYVTLATWYLDFLGPPVIPATTTSGYGLMKVDGTITPAGVAFKNFMQPDSAVASTPQKLPVLQVHTSNAYAGAPGANAVDGNLNTMWNAGGSPDQWIELDLGAVKSVSKIRLLVEQTPAGPTTHKVYMGNGTWPNQQLKYTFSGTTSSGQWLEYNLPATADVRYISIDTTDSSSWVAWREVEVYGN